jgi:hypothetical protein
VGVVALGKILSTNCSILPHAAEILRKLGSLGVDFRWISRE